MFGPPTVEVSLKESDVVFRGKVTECRTEEENSFLVYQVSSIWKGNKQKEYYWWVKDCSQTKVISEMIGVDYLIFSKYKSPEKKFITSISENPLCGSRSKPIESFVTRWYQDIRHDYFGHHYRNDLKILGKPKHILN